MAAAPTPAKNLNGISLPSGWTVIGQPPKHPTATGGIFSEGYLVENKNSRSAFPKTIDYSDAAASPDPELPLKQ